MDFPIFERELQGVLRRKITFIFALVFYLVLGLAAVYFFGTIQNSLANRGSLGRGLFVYVLVLGYPCVGLYSALYASTLLVVEREKGTLDFLSSSPIPDSSLISQKILAPMATSWLFVFGTLPIISLVFLLGGVSPGEMADQFLSILVWISTCVMIGAAVSARAKSSTSAVWITLAILVGIIGAPVMAHFYSLFNPIGVRNKGAVVSLAAPIFWFSPWGNGFFYANGFGNSGLLFWPNRAFSPPGLIHWLANLSVQLVLFVFLAKTWNRSVNRRGYSIVAERLTKLSSIRILLTPLLGESIRFFTSGERSFYEHQGKTLFTLGTRRILLILTVFFLVSWGVFLVIYTIASSKQWIYLLFLINTAVIGGFGIGMQTTSFARERDRETAAMLFTSPHFAVRIFLEKLKYYLAFTLKILLPAWGFPLVLWLIHFILVYNGLVYWDFVRLVWRVAAFIPLATLLAIYGGIVSRTGLAPIIVGAASVFAGVGFLVAFLTIISWKAFGLSPGLDHLPIADLIYILIPPTIMVSAAYLLIYGIRRQDVLSDATGYSLAILGLVFIVASVWDLVFLIDLDLRWLSNEVRWVFVPLSFAVFVFRYLIGRPEQWWIDKMTRVGS
ncbi:MAG: ABC transporter permease [Candidatus Omnitrophica bacterium]|nr:ABC transporter permease [Candidatus Omnitrophota bacterium]